MNKLLFISFLLGILLIFSSCSKTEKDFVGKYQTFISEKFFVNKDLERLMLERSVARYRNRKKKHVRAKSEFYSKLDPIELELFIDASENILKGILKLTDNKVQGGFMSDQSVKTTRIELETNNYRVNGDTLTFNIFQNFGKTSSSYETKLICQEDGKNEIWFLKSFINQLTKLEKSTPCLKGETKDFLIFNTITSSAKHDILITYYSNEIDSLQKLIDSKKYKLADQEALENGIKKMKGFITEGAE
ncbi:hypothetical protein DF185_09175 [Marinifilum breve]|uniref:Lipoprotein n=1 Tax=Marinifilum breve TaxID=2184082 RepID=A0A2V3ZZC3_9BACT|nr:hypothetical protein [Marinifilum breve]PXY01631.1 hypothetical protein DF185_09175 [Marinifilum breve]